MPFPAIRYTPTFLTRLRVARLSLKTRVTLITLVVFLVSLWSLSLYATRELRAAMERSLAAQQFSTVEFIASALEDDIKLRLNALLAFADIVSPEMARGAATVQASMERRPVLRNLFNHGFVITDANGIVIADVPASARRVGLDVSGRDFIAAALKEGKTTVGRPVMGRILKSPVLGMAAPIRNAQGRIIGAISGNVNLGLPSFLDRITENRYGKTGGYVIVDARHRVVVTATDRRAVMIEFPPPGAYPAIDRFIAGYEGTLTFLNPRGIEVLTSTKRLAGVDWYVSAQLPVEEAFSPIQDMQLRMLLVTLGVTLLAGVLTWWALRREFAPLVATATELSRMSGARETLQPLPVQGPEEIGRLIESFNRLLHTLTVREELLRQEVARRLQAQQEAEAASRAKSHFLSRMSHELRTPLNAILGYSQLMVTDPQLPADYQDGVHEIFDAGQHLLALINDVLDLAKIEAGRLVLRIERVPLAPLVDECLSTVRPLAGESGIGLESGGGSASFVSADRVRLKQVLLNLLSNAIKYNRPGGQVSVAVTEPMPRRIRIEVQDTGLGMSAAQMQQLFVPFNRLGAEKGQIEGTGIGLTITRHMVQMMGGEIGVASTPGVGSRFWIELPGAEEPVVAG